MTKQTLIPPAAADASETLLQGLIAECGDMIREQVRPAIEATDDPYRKSHLVHAAIDLVETGAKVADSIARLRGGQQAPELRQRITVERVQTLAEKP